MWAFRRFVASSPHGPHPCAVQVHGCNWRVENSRLLGKVKRAEGANPPASYAEGRRDEWDGERPNFHKQFLKPRGLQGLRTHFFMYLGLKVHRLHMRATTNMPRSFMD